MVPTTKVTYTIEDSFVLEEPICSGYKFLGWYLDQKCTKVITEIQKGHFGSLILYAKWEKAILTVKFECNGGSEINDIFVVYGDIIREEFSTTKDNAIF